MLDAEVEELWAEYLRAEQDRIRCVMMPALERFIDGLLQLPAAAWREWAKGIAASVSDCGADLPVRFPLFRRVLLPALAEGVRRGEPGCARWLASFELLLLKSNESELPPELRTAVGLLTEAVRIDPGDERARRRLIALRASYLEYTLHELPSGVLYGDGGATPEQCDDLLQLLGEFKEHVSVTRQDDRFAELIRDCDFHYRAYADYRRAGAAPGGYEAYLGRRAGGYAAPRPAAERSR
jgi:hypothetical protein